ncbi:MAG: hypothetical protein MH472_02705 [Bacteroidia bacterium]|nr:hypothetical protein [Bacteroidia bacterium]
MLTLKIKGYSFYSPNNIVLVPADNQQAYAKIISDLKSRKFYPVYILHGEEPYFIDEITDYIEKHVLTDAEKAFNQSIFYAKDLEIGSVIEAAKRYPMMANHQVIIVKEAQGFKKLDGLDHYIENPVPSTILVLSFKGKKLDGRSKLAKSGKYHHCFESKKLYEDSELPR